MRTLETYLSSLMCSETVTGQPVFCTGEQHPHPDLEHTDTAISFFKKIIVQLCKALVVANKRKLRRTVTQQARGTQLQHGLRRLETPMTYLEKCPERVEEETPPTLRSPLFKEACAVHIEGSDLFPSHSISSHLTFSPPFSSLLASFCVDTERSGCPLSVCSVFRPEFQM